MKNACRLWWGFQPQIYRFCCQILYMLKYVRPVQKKKIEKEKAGSTTIRIRTLDLKTSSSALPAGQRKKKFVSSEEIDIGIKWSTSWAEENLWVNLYMKLHANSVKLKMLVDFDEDSNLRSTDFAVRYWGVNVLYSAAYTFIDIWRAIQQLNYSLHLVTSSAFIGTVEDLERSVTLQQILFIYFFRDDSAWHSYF